MSDWHKRWDGQNHHLAVGIGQHRVQFRNICFKEERLSKIRKCKDWCSCSGQLSQRANQNNYRFNRNTYIYISPRTLLDLLGYTWLFYSTNWTTKVVKLYSLCVRYTTPPRTEMNLCGGLTSRPERVCCWRVSSESHGVLSLPGWLGYQGRCGWV